MGFLENLGVNTHCQAITKAMKLKKKTKKTRKGSVYMWMLSFVYTLCCWEHIRLIKGKNMGEEQGYNVTQKI